jgi:hypothetical protein
MLEHARDRPRYYFPHYADRRQLEGASLGRGVDPSSSRSGAVVVSVLFGAP